MSLLPLLLLSLYYLPTNCELRNSPQFNLNGISAHDDNLNAVIPLEVNESNKIESSMDLPYVKTGPGQTEVAFQHPINSVNIDYSKNALVLTFRKPHPILSAEEEERRKFLENNFMRFGRGHSHDFMRFGKRASEEMGLRDSRGDNFMRFGRDPADFMRFGRPENFMRFGRSDTESSSNFMRFGRLNSKLANNGKSFNNPQVPILRKSDIKEAARILHEIERDTDESNPVDKAIQVLFSKHNKEKLGNASDDNANQEHDY